MGKKKDTVLIESASAESVKIPRQTHNNLRAAFDFKKKESY